MQYGTFNSRVDLWILKRNLTHQCTFVLQGSEYLWNLFMYAKPSQPSLYTGSLPCTVIYASVTHLCTTAFFSHRFIELNFLRDSIPIVEAPSRMLPQLFWPDPAMSGTNRGIIIGQDFILLTHRDIPRQPQTLHSTADCQGLKGVEMLSRYLSALLGSRRGDQTFLNASQRWTVCDAAGGM